MGAVCRPRVRDGPRAGSRARQPSPLAYAGTAARPLLHAALNPSPPLTQRAVGGGIRATIPLQAALVRPRGTPGSRRSRCWRCVPSPGGSHGRSAPHDRPRPSALRLRHQRPHRPASRTTPSASSPTSATTGSASPSTTCTSTRSPPTCRPHQPLSRRALTRSASPSPSRPAPATCSTPAASTAPRCSTPTRTPAPPASTCCSTAVRVAADLGAHAVHCFSGVTPGGHRRATPRGSGWPTASTRCCRLPQRRRRAARRRARTRSSPRHPRRLPPAARHARRSRTARADPGHRPLPVPGARLARRLRAQPPGPGCGMSRSRTCGAASTSICRSATGEIDFPPVLAALRRHRLPGTDRRRTAPPLPRGPRLARTIAVRFLREAEETVRARDAGHGGTPRGRRTVPSLDSRTTEQSRTSRPRLAGATRRRRAHLAEPRPGRRRRPSPRHVPWELRFAAAGRHCGRGRRRRRPRPAPRTRPAPTRRRSPASTARAPPPNAAPCSRAAAPAAGGPPRPCRSSRTPCAPTTPASSPPPSARYAAATSTRTSGGTPY